MKFCTDVQAELFIPVESHIDFTCQLYTELVLRPVNDIELVYDVSVIQLPLILYLILYAQTPDTASHDKDAVVK